MSACGPETGTSESTATSTGEPGSTSTGTSSSTTDTPTGSTSDNPTTDATTGSDSSSTGDSTTSAACLEYSEQPFNDAPEVQFTCGLPLLCGGGEPVFFSEQNGAMTTDDIDKARCLAAALRDRTPGAIQYQQPSLGPHVTTIEILGEQAIYRDDYQSDFNWDYTERVHFLRPPEFFTDCAEGSAFAVFNCLEDAFLDECATELTCP